VADRLDVVRDCYLAYELGDRALIEPHLAPDFMFYAPPDPGIDLETYWERCWPNAQLIASFELVRLAPLDGNGDEVVVTYEAERRDGGRFRNTEVLTFRDEQVVRVEVYFGWDLPTQ
jgi:ketosteroid isomerase-like protein